MKYFLYFFVLILFSCSSNDNDIQDDNENPDNPDNPSNIIETSDFIKDIDENPTNNFPLGFISATSEMPLTFSLISQNPENSMSIISSSGFLKVIDSTKFDYEINPIVTGIVKVENSENSENINITINLNDIYECDTNNLNFVENNNNTSYSNRSNHKIVYFNEKFWSYGGFNVQISGNESSQIWSSNNGIDWDLEISNSEYGNLEGRIPIVFLNKVWLIGKGTNSYTEVWQSSDGKHFSEISINNNSFNNYSRSKHQLIVFNNKLFLIGGKIDGIYSRGVMSTSDGINWTSESTSNSFYPGRQNHVSLVFDNKIWVIGGDNDNDDYSDAWSSSDGINWTLVSEDGYRFSERTGHNVIAYNNKLWLWGGTQNLGYAGYHRYGDLWSSCDGTRWFQVDNLVSPYDPQIPYKVVNSEVIVFNNKIVSIGGYNGSSYENIWEFEE